MGKLGGEFEKFLDGLYGRHDEIQRKHSKWMSDKEDDLDSLEVAAGKFEGRMEEMEKEVERWLKTQEKHLKS